MKWDVRSFGPPMPRARTALDGPFVVACLAMFDAGLDSAAIAGRMHAPEALTAQAIRLGREARRVA